MMSSTTLQWRSHRRVIDGLNTVGDMKSCDVAAVERYV